MIKISGSCRGSKDGCPTWENIENCQIIYLQSLKICITYIIKFKTFVIIVILCDVLIVF
jgi:hypothetical protein